MSYITVSSQRHLPLSSSLMTRSTSKSKLKSVCVVTSLFQFVCVSQSFKSKSKNKSSGNWDSIEQSDTVCVSLLLGAGCRWSVCTDCSVIGCITAAGMRYSDTLGWDNIGFEVRISGGSVSVSTVACVLEVLQISALSTLSNVCVSIDLTRLTSECSFRLRCRWRIGGHWTDIEFVFCEVVCVDDWVLTCRAFTCGCDEVGLEQAETGASVWTWVSSLPTEAAWPFGRMARF